MILLKTIEFSSFGATQGIPTPDSVVHIVARTAFVKMTYCCQLLTSILSDYVLLVITGGESCLLTTVYNDRDRFLPRSGHHAQCASCPKRYGHGKSSLILLIH